MQSRNVSQPSQPNNLYSSIELSQQCFVFEIDIKFKNKKYSIIRKIKKNKVDKLLSIDDGYKYDEIERIKIKVIDINNIKNSFNIKFKLKNNYNMFNSKHINVSVSKVTLGFIECNYQLLF
jgi:hypothetical protein